MGQDNAFELVAVFHKVSYIRNNEIYSQQIGAGKHDAAVYGDSRLAVLDQHHIKAKLTEATQWDDSERFHAGQTLRFCLLTISAVNSGGFSTSPGARCKWRSIV